MSHKLTVVTETGTVRVDGRDVASWLGLRGTPDADDADWRERADEYVRAHPRPDAKTSAGIPAAQRLVILRRLAAGPATRADLLAAMRTVGWVGADDVENRLRDLRAGDSRAATPRAGLAVDSDGERWWLREPFPQLGDDELRAVGFAKAMLQRLAGPLAEHARRVLDGVLPGVAAGSGRSVPVSYRAAAADYQRFDAAMRERRPIHVTYFSLNSGRERTYDLVPVEYSSAEPTVKAICVPVTAEGGRAGPDLQFAMDRLRAVEALPDWRRPRRQAVALQRERLVLEVDDQFYRVLVERDLFGIATATAVQSPYDDTWRITTMFPSALGWDVMEQLCAWAGSVQVHEPLWLVNAICRRLRAGLRVMEEGGDLVLVKPEVGRAFADHGAAVVTEEPLPARTAPRKLAPRR